LAGAADRRTAQDCLPFPLAALYLVRRCFTASAPDTVLSIKLFE
jgi:hypothetical protein